MPGPVLVIKLGALGDLLLAEGALRDLREHHSGAEITLLTRPAHVAPMRRCPWVDRIIIDPRPGPWHAGTWWRLCRELRAARYAQVHDLQDSTRSRLYLRLAGAPEPGAWKLPRSVPALQRHDMQLRSAGIEPVHTRSPGAGWLLPDEGRRLQHHQLRQPFVVLLPGSSSRHARKRWPHYAELAARLGRSGILPVSVPGPQELAEPALAHALELRTADGGALGLVELAGVLAAATAVVGNDSGPTHLAASLGCPGLALFGTDRDQARRSCLERGRMRTLVAPGFAGLDAARVVDTLQALPRRDPLPPVDR